MYIHVCYKKKILYVLNFYIFLTAEELKYMTIWNRKTLRLVEFSDLDLDMATVPEPSIIKFAFNNYTVKGNIVTAMCKFCKQSNVISDKLGVTSMHALAIPAAPPTLTPGYWYFTLNLNRPIASSNWTVTWAWTWT